MTEADYQARFAPTPLERARRSGLIRNAAIVAGNSGDARFIEPLRRLLEDSERSEEHTSELQSQ